MMSIIRARFGRSLLVILIGTTFPASLPASDWTDWRGPDRNGTSLEKGLPTHWSAAGENLAWRVPYGGRSAPIVMKGRVYLQNAAGQGETLQERVMCFNADTGHLLWERRFNIFLSDVPPHRVGWASPVGDPTTGNIFVYGVGGSLLALSGDGEILWQRSLSEDFGLITTHGGRTVSPILEGDLVIVSGLNSSWGSQARGGHRFFAFDKQTGDTIWVSSPGGRPFDTTYSTPIGAIINGTRLIIAGGGDGAVHAIKPQTGEPVWSFPIAKRGINTGVVLKDNVAFVSHSEENLDGGRMGLIAAVDASATGTLGVDQIQWKMKGFLGGYSSPVIDGNRIYQIDNGANLYAFSVRDGKKLWHLNLGTIQRASPVLADGKLYVGTQNGKFFILEPGNEGCKILDEDSLSTESSLEAIIASVAVSGGRVYLVSESALYCIGKESKAVSSAPAIPAAETGHGPVTHIQVVPTEVALEPSTRIRFHARFFDSRGRRLPEGQATWSLEQLKGGIQPDGSFSPAAGVRGQAGLVRASVGKISASARLRVIPPLPWDESFDDWEVGTVARQWINATGKFKVRELEGNRVLVKLANNPFTKRAKVYMGMSDWSDYTVQVDVRAVEKRRQMGDAGVLAQRYSLILFGNHQWLELGSWQPETKRTVRLPFKWEPNTWYRVKLRVENLAGDRVRVRGRVWRTSATEPQAWTIEKMDSIPNRQGSPGIYADARQEIYFDNLKVTPNGAAPKP